MSSARASQRRLPRPAARLVGDDAIPTLQPKGDQTAIDGVWRLEVERAEPHRLGASSLDASNNEGTWTFTFKGGTVDYTEPGGGPVTGSMRSTAEYLSVNYSTRDATTCLLPVFSRSGDDSCSRRHLIRQLLGVPDGEDSDQYTPDSVEFETAFLANPLVRVGDAP